MKMRLLTALIVIACLAGTPPESRAEGGSGYRTISIIGCHLVSTLCYVYVSGANVGPPACSANSLRWDVATAPGGKQAFAQLTAAYLAGKVVNLYVQDYCSTDPAFPTFTYYEIGG